MAVKICKQGHMSEHGAQNHCLECMRLRAKTYRAKNPDHVTRTQRAYYAANREQRKEDGRKYYHANVKRTMLRHARKRADAGGYAFEITEADLEIPEFCPLLNIKIQTGGKLTPASPSLDKIIPTLGYVRGNVWVISHRANQIKSDASLSELELLVANLKNKCDAAGAVRQELIVPWAITPPTTKLESYPWQTS